jgi:hypothetical protein
VVRRRFANGTDWREVSLGTGRNLNGLAYGGGLFVAVGGVAYGDNRWLAVGNGGTILTSTDCVKWSSLESGTDRTLLAASFGNGTWVVVGEGGVILSGTVSGSESVPLFTGSGFCDQGFSISLTGSPESVFSIEASSSLKDWVVIGTATNSASGATFIDADAPRWRSRFYRAATPASSPE